MLDRSLTNALWALGGDTRVLHQPWERGPQAQVFKRNIQPDESQIFKKPFCEAQRICAQ